MENTITVKHLLNSFRKDIDKQLQALVNVGKRLKLTPPSFIISDVYEHEFSIEVGFQDESHDIEEEVYIEKCIDITINVQDTLKIDGQWVFACAIDHRSMVMVQADETLLIPAKYNPSNECCEHCNKKYPRVKSYVIYNQTTSEFKQVGKGCLKQFLGINPASYITMFEAISAFSPVIKGYGHKNSGGRLENLAYNVSDMLRYTIHQVKKDGGFIKTEWEQIATGDTDRYGNDKMRNVRTNEGLATIDKVQDRLDAIAYFRNNPSALSAVTTIEQLSERLHYNEKRSALFVDYDFQSNDRASARVGSIAYNIQQIKNNISNLGRKTLVLETIDAHMEEIAAVKNYIDAMIIKFDEETNKAYGFEEYKQSLKTVFLKDRTLQSNLKVIVGGYGFYLKQLVREAAERLRLENAVNLQHVGTVGEKIDLELTVVDLKTGEGQYGMWKLWIMKDASGNKFNKFGEINKKFTTIEIDPELNGQDVHIGSTINVTAEIKNHDVYREEKFTLLGRVNKNKKATYIYK